MSWDAIIAGALRFTKGGLAEWQRSDGKLPRQRWPEFIANQVDEDADGAREAPEEFTVASRLQQCALLCPTFHFDVDPKREEIRFRALVSDDEFWGAVNEVIRVVGAAAKKKATGRVFLRYAGSGFGHDDGAILLLQNGKLTTARIGPNEAPSREDEDAIDETHERARATLEELAVRIASQRRSKKKKR
jgi:hypothetical protein